MAATPAFAAPLSVASPPTGRALILIPLTLTKVQDLHFGSIIPDGSSPVTVTLDPSTGNRTSSHPTSLFAADPGTTTTACPSASTSCASSVIASGNVPRFAYASASQSRRNTCGVWACHSPARGTVPVMRFVAGSTRFSVSATGTAGIAAPYSRAAANTTCVWRWPMSTPTSA